ncbi:MAG: YceI family protein [Planctomycetes bacterium]|nr:YceI family protein [Planctomycetota bacterium]
MPRVPRMRFVRLAAPLVFVGSAAALAEPLSFDFKDPKGVNTITFLLDSLLEPIAGIASGISGTVTFDPASPKSVSGKLVVAADSLHTENAQMKKVLHGPDWLDVQKHPTIEFTFKDVKEVKQTSESAWELQVAGDFTCRGATKPLSAAVRLNYLRDKLGSRLKGKNGDLLVLRSDFVIKRSDYGIKPGGNDVVADEIQLRVSIVGSAVKESPAAPTGDGK